MDTGATTSDWERRLASTTAFRRTLFLMESGVRTGPLCRGQTSAHSQTITPPPSSTQENLVVSWRPWAGSLSPSPALRDELAQTPHPPSQGSRHGRAPAELRNWGQLLIPRPLICGDTWVWSLETSQPLPLRHPGKGGELQARGTSFCSCSISEDWGPMSLPPLTGSPGGAAPGPGTEGG